jgi:hypothetical protein
MWGICLVFKYDRQVMISFLMICFSRFNFTFEKCVIDIDLFNFQYEEVDNNMFNTRTFMEKLFNVLIVRKFHLFMMLFILPFSCANPISWWQSYEILSFKC